MEDSKTYIPDWLNEEQLASMGYKKERHPDEPKGYFRFDSFGGKALHREGRECEQPLWNGKRQLWFNCTYAVKDKAVYCKIYEDAGSRTVFNGVILSFEQLALILRLVE